MSMTVSFMEAWAKVICVSLQAVFWRIKIVLLHLTEWQMLFVSWVKKKELYRENILQEKNKGEVLWKKTKLLNLGVG